MKIAFFITMTILLSACGSNPHKVMAVKVGDEYYKPEPSAAMAIDTGAKADLVCKKRIVTGSHRKRNTCVTKKQIEAERKAAQENITNNQIMLQRQTLDSKGGGQ